MIDKFNFETPERRVAYDKEHDVIVKNGDYTRGIEGEKFRIVPENDYQVFKLALGWCIGASIPLPSNEFQARGMHLVGYHWLKDHAPHTLRQNEDKIVND